MAQSERPLKLEKQMPLGNNRILSDMHRVGLVSWTAGIDDPRVSTVEKLFQHVNASGYDGVEMSPRFFQHDKNYFPSDPISVIVKKVRREAERAHTKVFGSSLFIFDADLRTKEWKTEVTDSFRQVQDMGGEFVNVQFQLHSDYPNTSGEYRSDEGYLTWVVNRIEFMRSAAWNIGMNFYLETHIHTIAEDPEAFANILKRVTSEVTGDLSHYMHKAYMTGKSVDYVVSLMGHTHVRMCRVNGDLSAVVEDPRSDWNEKGITWQMFQMMKPGLDGGLSSREIGGESGAMHLVTDSLTQDVALLPLYRAMARYADASAQGIKLKVDDPEDLQPWG